MFRFRRDALVKEYVANGIGIGISTYQTGNGVAGDISPLAAVAKTPAEFYHAIALIDDATLAGLFRTGTVYIPCSDILELATSLVADREVLNCARTHISQSDITLRTLVVNSHLTRLDDTCITVFTDHHTYVQMM